MENCFKVIWMCCCVEGHLNHLREHRRCGGADGFLSSDVGAFYRGDYFGSLPGFFFSSSLSFDLPLAFSGLAC